MSDNIKELICIICPKGCHLKVDISNNYNVSGASCSKGRGYGMKELKNPTRTITSTIRVINNEIFKTLPVKTNKEIDKNLVMKATAILKKVIIKAPVKIGDVILENVLNTGVSFVSTKDIY